MITAQLMTLTVALGALFLAGYFTLRRRLVLAAVSLACFLAAMLPGPAMAEETCRPIRYADGDTFTFKRGGEDVRVRVAGFDAPERGQPFSNVATQMMRDLTQGGALCDCYKQDRYKRNVCTVRTRDGQNVATLMLRAGLGCIDPRFEHEARDTDRHAARAALAHAQDTRRGMWSQPDPMCAADYRRATR